MRCSSTVFLLSRSFIIIYPTFWSLGDLSSCKCIYFTKPTPPQTSHGPQRRICIFIILVRQAGFCTKRIGAWFKCFTSYIVSRQLLYWVNQSAWRVKNNFPNRHNHLHTDFTTRNPPLYPTWGCFAAPSISNLMGDSASYILHTSVRTHSKRASHTYAFCCGYCWDCYKMFVGNVGMISSLILLRCGHTSPIWYEGIPTQDSVSSFHPLVAPMAYTVLRTGTLIVHEELRQGLPHGMNNQPIHFFMQCLCSHLGIIVCGNKADLQIKVILSKQWQLFRQMWQAGCAQVGSFIQLDRRKCRSITEKIQESNTSTGHVSHNQVSCLKRVTIQPWQLEQNSTDKLQTVLYTEIPSIVCPS